MKEESVFWLGGKPGTQKAAEAAPEAGNLEPAIRDACKAEGLEPEDFVAALGAYGSWLIHFPIGEKRHRIVWNGRDRKLVLQAAIPSGGWDDLHDCPVASIDEAGFVSGIAALMRSVPGARG